MSAEAREALDIAEQIQKTYDDEVSDNAKDKGDDFFDSILDKAESIANTIKRHGTVTDNQRRALDNMLEGVRKWVHKD